MTKQPKSSAFDVEKRAAKYAFAQDCYQKAALSDAYKDGIADFQAFLRARAAEGFDIVASVKRYMAKWEVGAQAGIPYREGVEDALDFCAAREAELRARVEFLEGQLKIADGNFEDAERNWVEVVVDFDSMSKRAEAAEARVRELEEVRCTLSLTPDARIRELEHYETTLRTDLEVERKRAEAAERLAGRYRELLEIVDCECTVKERLSGHRSACHMLEIIEALAEAPAAPDVGEEK